MPQATISRSVIFDVIPASHPAWELMPCKLVFVTYHMRSLFVAALVASQAVSPSRYDEALGHRSAGV